MSNELKISGYGTFCTVILGAITKITANEVATFFMIASGASTTIFTLCKIYEWLERRSRRRTYEKRKAKNPT